MKQELQEELYKKYPKLFAQRHLTIMQSCMPFGIECGTGWYSIIDNACFAIQNYIDSRRQIRTVNLRYNRALKYALAGKKDYLRNIYKKLYRDQDEVERRVEEETQNARPHLVTPHIPQIQFTQVKEKFGSLRLYINYTNDYIDGVISMASLMSEKTCETCGNPGKMRGRGWYYTACDEHTNEQDKKSSNEEDEV